MIRLKVCCIASREEAAMAIRYGASALGLVSEMPSGPGPIPDDLIADIASSVPPPVATFLLTCRTDPDEIIDQVRYCRTNTVQLVDSVSPAAHDRIHRALPHLKIVQVIHVMDESALTETSAVSSGVDALLLDSGNPRLPVKELGGTGRVHNWEISRKIVEVSPCPVFLAGGINPDNAAAAVSRVQPFGLDLCSGIRTDDRLDEAKLLGLVTALVFDPP